jgi:hypothetical protein
MLLRIRIEIKIILISKLLLFRIYIKEEFSATWEIDKNIKE